MATTKNTAAKRSTKRAAATTNAVDHKAFFPILAQSAGEGRGQAYKADATVETAAPIVVALVKSLAKLGGLKASDILAAAAGAKSAPAAKANAKPVKRPVAEKPARAAKAKAMTIAAGDKVLAADAERNGRFFRAVIVKSLKGGERAKVRFPDGFETIVDVKTGIQPRAKRGA